jgi:hypothetical protein
MKVATVAILGMVVILMCVTFGGCSYVIGTGNKEARGKVLLIQAQKENENRFANMKKRISGAAQVSDRAMESLRQILVGYGESRNIGDTKSAVMTWVKESVPNVDLTTMNNLQNIVISSLDDFADKQTAIIDYQREYNNLYAEMVSGFVLKNVLHREQYTNVVIVTSSQAKQAFSTGIDDDDNVFKNKIEKIEK